jgi:hypothetical protein
MVQHICAVLSQLKLARLKKEKDAGSDGINCPRQTTHPLEESKFRVSSPAKKHDSVYRKDTAVWDYRQGKRAPVTSH